MQRFLAIQTKRIGDLILTAPAIRLLRRRRPDAHITLVTAGVAGQLASCIPGINDHLNFNPRRLNSSLWGSLLLDPYDVSLDFNGTDRSVGMSFVAGAKIRSGYTKRALIFPRSAIITHTSSASLKKLHTIDHMMALLETIGIQADKQREPLQLEIPETVQAQSRQIAQHHGVDEAKPFTVIHPGTARSEKYWGASCWAAVADYLILERKHQVVITGGGDREEIAHIKSIDSQIKPEARSQLIDLSGKLSLPQTASIISQSQLALGVDTAAMHLAAAFEKPQLVLYGPTNPYHWRPLHDHAQVMLAGFEKPLTKDDYQIKIPETSMSLITDKQVIEVLSTKFKGI